MAYKNYPYKIRRFNSLSSTQDKAKEFAEKGLSEIVVVADKQTKGRGRFGRKWHSGKNGLWMSILLKPKNAENLQCLTFAASIAVAGSIKKISGLDAKIKWPNDVHCKGKKLCGILAESILGKENYVIIGIGLNLNQKVLPDGIKDLATSLKILKNKEYDKKAFLKKISGRFFDYYNDYNKNNFRKIKSKWEKYCDTIGKNITVTSRKRTFKGMAVRVDKDCNLILSLNNGKEMKIVEGDIKINILTKP